MRRAAKAAALLAGLLAMACTAQDTSQVSCDEDAGCPYQQCCVDGACVDPGPVGSCLSAALGGGSLLTVTPQSIMAGSTADVVIALRDVFGRPIAGATASVLVQSSCNGCEQVQSADWSSDASGLVHGTFTSTIAGDKTLLLRVGSQLGEPVMLHVVPDVAVSVGFAGTIDDTRVDHPLSNVAVTRLDAFGNPDALPAPGSPLAVDVEIQLDVNPGALVLANILGLELDLPTRTIHLDQPRVAVDGLYVSLVAYALRLTAADVSPVPQLAASVSNDFDVTAPHLTSDMPDVLTSPSGAPVNLSWSATPNVPVIVREGTALTAGGVSPQTYTAEFDSETANLAHVVIEPGITSAARDVEASRVGDAKTFTPSIRANSQVNITDLDTFPDGDVLVTGTFSFDVRLGERDGVAVVATSVATSALEGFVARFDPTLRELRWYVLYYAVNSTSRGVNVAVRDSVISESNGVLLLAEFQGAFASWRFDEPGATGSTITQCVVKGAANDTTSTTWTTLDGTTGVVSGCAGLYDNNPDAAQVAAVRAGATGALGGRTFAALRVTKPYVVAPGVMITTPGVPGSIPGGPAANPVAVSVPPAESGCTTGAVALTSLKADGTLDTSLPVLFTAISFEPEKLITESSSDLLLAGSGCSGGVINPIEVGGTEKVTTVKQDAMVLRVDIPVGGPPTPGTTMHLVWNSHGTLVDRLTDVQRLGATQLVVVSDFQGSVAAAQGTVIAPVGVFSGYVGLVDRGSAALQWARQLNGETSAVTTRAVGVMGDRITALATSFDDLQFDDTPHRVIDMNDNQPEPVGLLLELDPSGEVRWSSLFSGATSVSEVLPLSRGRVMLGINGLQGALVFGALDATPVRQTNQRGGRTEPVVGVLTPYDFVSRDILRE